MIAGAPMGDANASIPTPQPVHYRPMFGALGKAVQQTSITFVSKAALETGSLEKLGLEKKLSAVSNTRTIRKADMKLNDYQPVLEVDPQTYVVTADGEELHCEPATELPMAQRYYLF